jgi:hypothetical protein
VTGVCIPTGNVKILLATVYKSPTPKLNDTDITELLKFRNKSILVGDLKAKYRFWNSTVPNLLWGGGTLVSIDANYFRISAPQHPTHHSHAGNGDVLDIVVHHNIRLSHVSDILHHLPTIFHIRIMLQQKKPPETT